MERQQKLDSRGKKKQEKAGVSRIMMNTLRNNAENSTSKTKSMHAEKIGGISQELQEHDIRMRLNRFLFSQNDLDKSCNSLSGGEKMRLMLCCLTINNESTDLIILDEPTNNLDIQNIEILTAAINEYQGTLIVISHDEYFLEQINIKKTINLN
jgi:ATPase subunit of ABC transporter with duplicated ATPase domains